MTSVSLLVWKIEPSRTSSSRSSRALTRLPLWRDGDLAVRAVDQERLRVLEPALAGRRVARVADREVARQRRERRFVEGVGDVAHRARRRAAARRRRVTMPALSWPRCCSAYRPRYVRLAASGCPKMPKTPHSSLNLSSMWSWRSPGFALFYAAGRAKYRSSAVDQICSASATAQSIADVPVHAPCARRAPPVRPIDPRRDAAPRRASCSSVARFCGAHRHDHARRRFAEERRVHRRGPSASTPARRRRSRCRLVSNAHSASVTARPPSEQSCAERSRPADAPPRRAARCSARSRVEVERRRLPLHEAVHAPSGTRCRRARRCPRRAARCRRPAAWNVRASTRGGVVDQRRRRRSIGVG